MMKTFSLTLPGLKQSKKNTIEQEYYINLVSIMFRIVRN